MSGTYYFGAYEFASSRVELRKRGLRIKVPDQSLKILAALVAQPGELVSRERIQALLWPNGTVVGFERSINTAVRRLREALGDTAGKPKYIESVPRHGYRFIATVERFQAEQPQGLAQAGSLMLHYRLLEKVGSGSMGEVWKAEDTELRRTVALKVLPEFLAGQSHAIDGLRQEARHAAALNHPNICTIYGIEQCGGRWFLVMEYINGHPLSQELTTAPSPIGRIRDAGMQIAEALAAAHSRGVIHRDVTPSNVLVSNATFKLTDFGIAQLSTAGGGTAQGNAAGTIGYMSPEQALGQPVDGRSDLFSLGVVLYRMATGRMPFGRDTPADVTEVWPHQAPVAPSALNPAIPRELERVILKALERDIRARWRSAGEIAEALRALRIPPNGRGSARRRFRVAAGLVLASALGAGAWFAHGRWAGQAVAKVSAIAALPGEQWGPALSPDGRQLAFVWDGEVRGNHDIYVQRIGEGTPRRLTRDPAFEWGPAWSPDARHIAFLRQTDRGADVVIVPSAGGTERTVHRSTAHCRFEMKRTVAQFCGVAWSPGGKHLAVTDTVSPGGSNSIFLLNLESGDRRQLTNPPAGWFGDGLPRFSPDGGLLVFARSRAPFPNDLFKLTLSPSYEASGEPQSLTQDGFVFGFDFTAEARGVVYASRRGGVSALWQTSTSGGQPESQRQPRHVAVDFEDGRAPGIYRGHPGLQPLAHSAAEFRRFRCERLSGSAWLFAPARFSALDFSGRQTCSVRLGPFRQLRDLDVSSRRIVVHPADVLEWGVGLAKMVAGWQAHRVLGQAGPESTACG